MVTPGVALKVAPKIALEVVPEVAPECHGGCINLYYQNVVPSPYTKWYHKSYLYTTDRAQLYPLGDFSNIHFEKLKFALFFCDNGAHINSCLTMGVRGHAPKHHYYARIYIGRASFPLLVCFSRLK